MSTVFKNIFLAELESLSQDQQQKLLEYVLSLKLSNKEGNEWKGLDEFFRCCFPDSHRFVIRGNFGSIGCLLTMTIRLQSGKERKKMDHYEAVLDYLHKADQPLSAGQIAGATGVDRKEVDKVMAKLKKKK